MEQIGKALSPPKPGCSLILEDWMFDLKDSKGKRLTDTALHLYALIYGFSKHRAGIYFGTSSYTQARLRASLSAIKSAFRLLKDAGLIANVESQAEFGGQRRGWSVLPLNDDKRRTSVGGQNLTPLEPDSGETDAATSGSITPSSENPQVSDTDVEDQSPICTQYNHDDDDNRTPVGGQNLTPCGRNLAPEGQNLTSEGSESDPSFESCSQVAKENSTPETKGNPTPNRKDEYKDPLPYSNASSEDGASEEAYDGARRLMAESLNRTTPLPRVASCIEQCFAKGYAIDDILSGYRAYIAAYKAEHDTPRYVMRLDTFLTSPKGLALPRRDVRPSSMHPRPIVRLMPGQRPRRPHVATIPSTPRCGGSSPRSATSRSRSPSRLAPQPMIVACDSSPTRPEKPPNASSKSASKRSWLGCGHGSKSMACLRRWSPMRHSEIA